MASEPYFHVFPNLPGEMRLKVWGFVLSQPRTVAITCERGIRPGNAKRYAKAFGSKNPPPALLHVNHEARFEALGVYQSCFKTEHSTKCTYVAFDRDIIQLPEGVLTYVPQVDLDCIRSMSINVKDVAYFGHFSMDILRKMAGLKELELVAGNGQEYSWRRPEGSYVNTLKGDFDEAMLLDPGWECPRVRIVSQTTGQEMAVIEGGAAIPGFTSESALPSNSETLVLF